MSAIKRIASGPSAVSLPEPPAAAPIMRSWRARLREYWVRLQSRRLLAVLDDGALRDIGVTRSEAQQETAKPFWRA